MTESLFSPLWYRVAGLRPRLPAGVQVHRRRHRGTDWHVIAEAGGARQFRLNRAGYRFVGSCDGQRSVQDIWDALVESLDEQAPTQHEVVRLLVQLSEAGLIDCGLSPDLESRAHTRGGRPFPNPLAFRIPIGNPDRWLSGFDGLAAQLLTPSALRVWLFMTLAALTAAAMNRAEIVAHAAATVGTSGHLLLAWIAYPFIKALHELGHGLAVRRWGGEVREAGIGLFVLTPAPYVDASASATFRERHQRAAVAGMGIAVEVALAAVALAVWLNVQPGTVRDMAFAVMTVAGFSTLLFNANPLLQFDGYHLLTDVLDLPNLASRSRRFWVARIQRLVFGPAAGPPPHVMPGEGKWLVLYAPASALYRAGLSLGIVLWMGSVSLVLGMLVAAYTLATVVIEPLARLTAEVQEAAGDAQRRSRARLVFAAVLGTCALFACVVPLPFRTAASGVVWLPESAHARAETEGFITAIAARDGEAVQAGQLLVRLEDPALVAQATRLANRLRGLRADRFEALGLDPAKAANLEEEIRRVEGEIARVEERLTMLEVRSPASGTFVMPLQRDVEGTWVKRGRSLGYVLDHGEVSVRAAVPEVDAALIRAGHRDVEARVADDVTRVRPARMVREIPAATRELPSAALGDRGGGSYVTDPADRDGVRTQEPVVLIDLALPTLPLERVGGRVWVRFDHGPAPLAMQAWRRARQLFLQHFNPGA